jgi:hypothetical protein
MHLESRKATSKSTIAARARTLHAKDLAWLEGFPLEVQDGQVRWMSVPPQAPAQEIRIEGRHLSRATWAINKLRTELAPGLPRLADDPDGWLSSIESRLQLLKGAIHHGRPLPPADSLVQILSWVHAGDPARARTVLGLAQGWSAGYGVLAGRLGEQPGLLVMLRLLQLAADHGKKRVDALASCLFDVRIHDVNMEKGWEACQRIMDGLKRDPEAPVPDELPAGSLGRLLTPWCEELVQESRRAQQFALRLFELATPLPAMEPWGIWWDTLGRLLREARVLAAKPYEKESRKALRARLKEHQGTLPKPVEDERLVSWLRRMTPEHASRRAAPLLRVLALVPAGSPPGRTDLFVHWARKNATLIEGFERYLRHSLLPDAALLQPWTEVRDLTHWFVEDELGHSERPRRKLVAAYEHLAAVASEYGGLDRQAAVKAVETFLLAGDSDLAAQFFRSLREANHLDDDHYHLPMVWELAAKLCRERPERFADVLVGLSRQEEELPHMLQALSSGELSDFVRESIVTGQLARFVACGTKSTLISAAEIQPLPQPGLGDGIEPEWVRHYPPRLHPALRRLAALLDDPEDQVARWLGSDFPDGTKLRREIAAIESRLDQVEDSRKPALRIRLENLRERLARPAVPGEARIARLQARLERAWGRAVLDRWERELDALLPAALGRLLDLEMRDDVHEIPACLSDPRTLALLTAATKLKPARRQLALRMFRVRCGPPPWDLRDAPQNRAFIESLPRLDWGPWIDGVGTVAVSGSITPQLHLALEDDPLEIFRMGAHFQTCLSPGSVNYFSVFTNAADINKRVLYARDDSGKVVGRCLLALTAEGRLLRFEAYCHDGSLNFGKTCDDFAGELARRMGTEVVSLGKVPKLVASDWYDDGAHDPGHGIAALEKGSPLRRRLAALPPGELLGELRRALKPARLDEWTLPLVLSLPELSERPELAVPLLRRVAECPTLPDDALLTAARLGVQAGSGDLVRRLLLRRVIEYLLPIYENRGWVDPRATDLVLGLDPARYLDILRRTRDGDVRDWQDERNAHRLEIAARALQALHRPRQAHALWQLLAFSARVQANQEQRNRARVALEQFETR